LDVSLLSILYVATAVTSRNQPVGTDDWLSVSDAPVLVNQYHSSQYRLLSCIEQAAQRDSAMCKRDVQETPATPLVGRQNASDSAAGCHRNQDGKLPERKTCARADDRHDQFRGIYRIIFLSLGLCFALRQFLADRTATQYDQLLPS